jgi:hypothetical protein
MRDTAAIDAQAKALARYESECAGLLAEIRLGINAALSRS